MQFTSFTDGPFFSYEGQEQVDGAFIVINASETDDINITCSVTATNPIVTSLSLARPPGNNVYFDNETGTITIAGANVTNAGIYTCTADNAVTTPNNISFVLTVNGHPTANTTKPATSTASEFTYFLMYKAFTLQLLLANRKVGYIRRLK